jgi:hypothetical protein
MSHLERDGRPCFWLADLFAFPSAPSNRTLSRGDKSQVQVVSDTGLIESWFGIGQNVNVQGRILVNNPSATCILCPVSEHLILSCNMSHSLIACEGTYLKGVASYSTGYKDISFRI